MTFISYIPQIVHDVVVTMLTPHTFFVRAPFADYYIVKKSPHKFDIEDAYTEHFIDEAQTFEDACKTILKIDTDLHEPW